MLILTYTTMIILKQFEVALDIPNCIMFYSDPSNLITRLRMEFKGKCHGGALIRDITRVIDKGFCTMTQDGNPTFGTVSVRFEAEVDLFLPFEIINGVEIIGVTATTIMCNTANATIFMSMDDRLRPLRKGQLISVRVGDTRYTKGNNKVTINAIPLLPSPEYNVYRVLPPRDLTILEDVQKRIKAEEAAKKSGGQAWMVFDKILDAYNTPSKPAGKIIPLSEISTLTSGYICRDPKVGSNATAVHYEDFPNDPNAKLVPVACLDEACTAILEDYCARLRTAREMAATYSTEKLITDHANLWRIFKSVKV